MNAQALGTRAPCYNPAAFQQQRSRALSLTAGQRVGPYAIVAPLGAGGMGEVYRALDTRLDREVAIKVLPEGFAADEQRRARFEREAKAISSLSHPHICTLHDVGQVDGIDYLVMELLKGESLADRLARGPLPPGDVLRYGAEIAAALDCAHKHAVVHRDLKPGNVVLTKSGAKLVDFGLARSTAHTAAPRTSSDVATAAKPLTEQGTILGTFQYMAPEQLEGQEADSRSDIYALGALLFEMATARRAFEGKSRTSLIAAIVSSQPPLLSSIVPLCPPALDHVVRRCLEKDPDDRWQSAHDVASELRWIAEFSSQTGLPAQIGARRRSSARLGWIAAALFFATTLGALWWGTSRSEPPLREPRTVRSNILPPRGTSFTGGVDVGSIAVSPDGTKLVFAAGDARGKRMLYVRPIESLVAQPLAGTEGGRFPFWSPDGRQIAFFASNKLLRVDAAGGAAFTVCDAADGRGGSWNRDGVILFAADWQGGLSRVAAVGGPATPVTQIDPSTKETTHRFPYFLPDGNRFIYLAAGQNIGIKDEVHGVYLSSLDSPGTRRKLVATRANAQVSQDTLLFLRDHVLMAQRLDPTTIELIGDPFPVAEAIRYQSDYFAGAFSVSQNGILAYRPGTGEKRRLLVVDERGEPIKELGPPAAYGAVRASPQGRRVAATLLDDATGNEDVWVYDVEHGTKTRITFAPTRDANPVWSPDGTRLAYQSEATGNGDIYVRSASGSGNEEVLYASPAGESPLDWSPDGTFIALSKVESNKQDIWLLNVETGKAEPLVTGPFEEGWGYFSPDGKWLAYLSSESGQFHVNALRFPNVRDGRWQISTDSVEGIVGWKGDGTALYYIDSDFDLVRVRVAAREGIEVGPPQKLFGMESYLTAANFGDGKSFVVARSPEVEESPITLVVDWLPQHRKH